MSDDYSLIFEQINRSNMEKGPKQDALNNLARANDDEKAILFSVLNIRGSWRHLRPAGHVAEILRGAHVRIWDSGKRYDEWKSLRSAQPRMSSHRSDGTQYHVDGPLVHTVLFGKIGDQTWFQLEGHPVGFSHFVDFFVYKWTHENQGPYGSSPSRDNDPIQAYPERYWREKGDYVPSGLGASVG